MVFVLGISLRQPNWKKGYGTEAGSAVIDYALGKIELGRLVAYPRQKHRLSQRVLEKLGFSKTERAGGIPVYGVSVFWEETRIEQ